MTNANCCPKCGENTVVLHERRGHLEVFRCQSCDWEGAGTFYPASDVAAMERDLKECRLRLASPHPGLVEARALRQLLPEYRESSLAAVREGLQEGTVVCTRPRRFAEELQKQARTLGVELAMEEVVGDD